MNRMIKLVHYCHDRGKSKYYQERKKNLHILLLQLIEARTVIAIMKEQKKQGESTSLAKKMQQTGYFLLHL